MKKLLTSILLAAAALPLYCQITLTQANVPLPADTVTFYSLPAPLTLPSGWANQTWDYSTLTATFTANTLYVPDSTDAFFTTAKFYSPGYFKNIATIFGQSFGYNYTGYFNYTGTGTGEVGIDATEQHYGIGALTGRVLDSLIVLDSKSSYAAAPRQILSFPATAGSTWNSVTRHVVNMTLTDSAAGLNAAPLTHVFYTYRTDSIIGWGTLNVPSGSMKSGPQSVIVDRINQYTVDSFYLFGSPAPQQLLTAFSMTQGGDAGPNVYRDYFYRAGEWAEVMEIIYSDNTYTTQSYAYVTSGQPMVTGINEINAAGEALTYPNPISGTHFFIQTTGAENIARVALTDVAGRQIEPTIVSASNGKTELTLSSPLTEGIYIYAATDQNGKPVCRGKLTAIK